MSIEDTTLQDNKVHAAIAGKNLIEPVNEHNTILDYFMKWCGKSRERVFKTSQMELALEIEPWDFVGMTAKRDQVYKLDESGIAISCKVMVGIHNLVIIDLDVSCSSYASYPIDC